MSRFGTTSKVLANFADHATTVDDLILCRPLDWHDCEPVLKAAMILSCGLQGDDAWVSTSRVSSLIKQLPQSHKQQTLRLKTLLRRSDVDKYFKIKKEDDGAQIHMRPLSKSESTHDRKIEFTEYVVFEREYSHHFRFSCFNYVTRIRRTSLTHHSYRSRISPLENQGSNENSII